MKKEYLTVDGLAKLFALNKNTIYTLMYRGEIPYHRLGKRIIRFDKEQLIKWFEDRQTLVTKKL